MWHKFLFPVKKQFSIEKDIPSLKNTSMKPKFNNYKGTNGFGFFIEV